MSGVAHGGQEQVWTPGGTMLVFSIWVSQLWKRSTNDQSMKKKTPLFGWDAELQNVDLSKWLALLASSPQLWFAY
jgi:hypothetical protein